jgi:hypothetical protein
MSNTEKAQFFALYWNQPVWKDNRFIQETHTVGNPLYDLGTLREYDYLFLTPLSSITDEDAIEVARIEYQNVLDINNYSDYACVKIGKDVIGVLLLDHESIPLRLSDFLRSRGYLLPWKQYTVDEILAKGWAKTK